MTAKYHTIITTLLFCILFAPALFAQTASEMAVSDYERPDYAPKYSDVCFSSRWPRGVGYREVETYWGTSIPFDTIDIMKQYHATRLDWIYLRGYDQIYTFLPKLRAEGVSVSAAMTSNLGDDEYAMGPRMIGRLLDSDGTFLTDAFENNRGCVNNEDFKAIFLREIKHVIDAGATDLQVDDPTLNDGDNCYCEYCLGIKNGNDSTTEFYTWLHTNADPYYNQQYGISKFPIHGNNTSRNRYTDSYFANIPNYRLDYGLGECDWKYLSAQHLHNVSLLARTYAGGNRAQIITAPGKPMEDKDIVWFQALTRRHISTCYAQGMHAIAPFDRFDCAPPGAGDEVQSTRFFGKPENYADLYGFARGIAIYLDDYEWAWDWGRTPKADISETGPYGDTWGTPPASDQPVTAVDDGIAVVIRAKPGTNDDPVAIHLVEWDNPNGFNITLRNDRFFGESTDNLRLTLLEPVDNYDTQLYQTVWENLNYTAYVQTTVLNGSYSGGETTVTIPPVGPWAVLMVSKGKSTPLPLYDSPRWQQLRDAAPAYAAASSPSNGIIAGPTQSLALSFDKTMDTSTINTTNIEVKHLESDTQVEGTWSTVGSLAIFRPTIVYKKGTIQVMLTPQVTRSNGTGCLYQKFIYTYDENVCDLSGDEYVSFDDFSPVAADWNSSSPTADITGDSYISIQDIWSLMANWLTCYTEPAEILTPADGIKYVTVNPKLTWDSNAAQFDIYIGTDENSVANATPGSPEFVTTTLDKFYTAGPLNYDTTYFWRVDAIGLSCTNTGPVYSFTTTNEETLAYWELDTNGTDAVGNHTLNLAEGHVVPEGSVAAVITNPDTTTPWNGADSSAANTSSLSFDNFTLLKWNGPDSPFQFRRSCPFTAEAYIRPTGGTSYSNVIFGTRDTVSEWNGWYLRYDVSGQRLSLYMVHPSGSISTFSNSYTLPLNVLKHIAMVWDPDVGSNGEIRFYVDGSQVGSFTAPSYWDDQDNVGWNLMVGARQAEDLWGYEGQIDELRWTPRALDPEDFLSGTPAIPDAASSPYPSNGQTDVPTNVVLEWANGANTQTHDVYFGTTSPGDFQGNQAENSFFPGALQTNTTYFWRVDEKNSQGTTTGPVWSFTTSDQLIVPATDTLAYWELETDGSAALGGYHMTVTQGAITPNTSYKAQIANPDATDGFSGQNTSAQNISSLNFDGSTALTYAAADNTFAFTKLAAFTCEAYVRPTGGEGSTNVIFGNRDTASSWKGWYLRYDIEYNRVLFYMEYPDGAGYVLESGGAYSLPFNEMKHVAVVWDPSAALGGILTVYVDGEVDIQFEAPAAWNNDFVGKNFMVGGRNNSNAWGFVGQIDEVRYNDRAMSPNEFLNAQ